MNKFVSVRIKKLRAWGAGSKNNGKQISGVEGLTAHDLRLINTPNADPKRLHDIVVCCKETEWKPTKLSVELAKKIGADSPNFISRKAKTRIQELGIKDSHPDSCKVVHILLTVSPQWLRDGSDTQPINPQKSEQFTRIANEFLREKFGDNYLGGVGHEDELNTHFAGYMVPAVFKERKKRGRKSKRKQEEPAQKTWGLDSKSLFTPDKRIRDQNDPEGEKEIRVVLTGTLSKLQSEFAEYCQKKGLDVVRGIVGSRAKHEDIATYNHLLRAQTRTRARIEDITDIETLQKMVIAGTAKAQDYDRVVRELEMAKNQLAEQQAPLLLKHQQLEKEMREIDEDRRRIQKELFAKTRAVSVKELIEKLTGAEARTTQDPDKFSFTFHTGMILEVDEYTNRFRNLTPEIPGQGNMREKTSGRGGIDAAISSLAAHRKPQTCSSRIFFRWMRLRLA